MRHKKSTTTQNKFLIFSMFLTAFLFRGGCFVSAMEVNLGLGDNPDLPKYITFIFSWAISIAGVLSLISFIVGAVGLIISGDSTEASSNAKDRMKGAVMGLLLTLCSLLILTTINPVFKTPTLTPLPAAPAIATPIITGVFYYTESNCKGTGSGPNTSSQNHIDSAFAGKIKSIKIINDPAKDIYYGAIFHATPGLENGGVCSSPVTDATECYNFSAGMENLSAADIFLINKKTPNTFGTGVDFYSEAYGWTTGANAGKKIITDTEISNITKLYTYNIKFDYTNINRLDAYKHKCDSTKSADADGNKEGIDCSKNACETFQDCPGSIKINGSYVVAVYGLSSPYSEYADCQTFIKDVENLDAEQISAQAGEAGDKRGSVYIIPTK